ncbi:MAG: archaellin/type IV pilin N-terminal domain-containing protein [Candidatus Methanomethylicia archaeon]
MRRLNRRGISPVIATIIIVAVAIAIAIAVAFWVVGIAGLFTRFEKLEITYIYVENDQIKLRVRNTGSAAATIDQIFLNGIPAEQNSYSYFEGDSLLTPGDEAVITIDVSEYSSGTTVEVKLHTAAGQEYYKAVVIP